LTVSDKTQLAPFLEQNDQQKVKNASQYFAPKKVQKNLGTPWVQPLGSHYFPPPANGENVMFPSSGNFVR
jgi:hypothetical protein